MNSKLKRLHFLPRQSQSRKHNSRCFLGFFFTFFRKNSQRLVSKLIPEQYITFFAFISLTLRIITAVILYLRLSVLFLFGLSSFYSFLHHSSLFFYYQVQFSTCSAWWWWIHSDFSLSYQTLFAIAHTRSGLKVLFFPTFIFWELICVCPGNVMLSAQNILVTLKVNVRYLLSNCSRFWRRRIVPLFNTKIFI